MVEGADEVIVTLADKREFKAKIIGSDKRSDVALVKIDASGLPTVRIGDVSKLKVGEWVIAIGSPFGLESTVTAGIVSAKSRDTGDLLPLIQTDVAINPGNSGGPLINMRGEVVGINSQIYSRSGGYMGISFAIPIDEATRVSEQLRVGGRVIRGRIGVVIARLTREVAESIGLGKPVGALVQSVESGGPADKAGVEPGDVITKVDGRAVESSVELPRIVGNIKPGTKATLQVFRRGSSRELASWSPSSSRSGSRRASPPTRERQACAGQQHRPRGLRSERCAEARAQGQERRQGRDRGGRRRSGRHPRERRGPQHRQHRSDERPAVRQPSSPSSTRPSRRRCSFARARWPASSS